MERERSQRALVSADGPYFSTAASHSASSSNCAAYLSHRSSACAMSCVIASGEDTAACSDSTANLHLRQSAPGPGRGGAGATTARERNRDIRDGSFGVVALDAS